MMSDIVSVSAPAKLNLALNITGRRADGYHELDSLFAFCDLSDELAITHADELTLSVTGSWAGHITADSDNLVLRAAQMLREHTKVIKGASIQLTKHIPVAAGLGGGSADAAAALRGLNRFWNSGCSEEVLLSLAARLGADVPACLASKPVLARGIGEVLTPLPALRACGVLLVNPRVETPTPQVFKAFARANAVIAQRQLVSLEQSFANLDALVEALRPRGNDLLEAATSVSSVIADVLDALHVLPDCRYAHLSGSGATCFALFETEALAKAAAKELSEARLDWWSWAGGWAKNP
ncbi:MAG: 4-(cytidine 5'-diphospho)-2-C-methyl-D-erythritol kinase [Beijerinckiaceae bacterium]